MKCFLKIETENLQFLDYIIQKADNYELNSMMTLWWLILSRTYLL